MYWPRLWSRSCWFATAVLVAIVAVTAATTEAHASGKRNYGSGHDRHSTNKPFKCNVPPANKITNFAWNRAGEDKSGPFFPLSSASNQAIEREMVGTGNATNCVRMKWSDDDITVLEFYADPQKPTYFSCAQIDPPKNAWNCKHLRANHDPIDLSHTAYVTLTDNHNYSFTVRCFPGIQAQGWTVFTAESKLCKERTQELKRHAQELGFPVSPEDLVTRDYSQCPAVCLP